MKRRLIEQLRALQKDYASQVCERLKAAGLFADVDNGADTLPKKVRNGEIAQYNFILGMLTSPAYQSVAHPS